MATMIAEVYDALLSAGAADDKARKAAEAIAAFETRFSDLAARIDQFEGRMNTRMERLEGRVNAITWMIGTNITLTLLMLGKLFLAPGR